MFLRAGVFSGVFAVAFLANGGALAANGSVTATSGDTFSPAAVTINQGESVTWTNGGGNHNVVLADGDVPLKLAEHDEPGRSPTPSTRPVPSATTARSIARSA